MNRVIPAACALASLLMAAPAISAAAEPAREVFTPRIALVKQEAAVDVSGGLASYAARAALLDRIEAASAAVCQARPPGGPEPWLSQEQVECQRAAMGRAVRSLGDAPLWAMAVPRIRALRW